MLRKGCVLQCMLNEPGGQMVSVAERQERFNLGEVKEELLTAMGLNTEAEGSALAFLRRGYKACSLSMDSMLLACTLLHASFSLHEH